MSTTARSRSNKKSPPRRPHRFVVPVSVAVVFLAAVVIAVASRPGKSGSIAVAPVVAATTHVPVSVFAQVGAGTANSAPKPIAGPALTSGGKPEILYIGAEYCPYCAAERWALVVALSRFGTFSGLTLTHSSSVDVYPDTATFSFATVTYTSAYLVFDSVETATNTLGGNGTYHSLQTPTAAQEAVWVALDPQRSIPFVDLGGTSAITGATYDPAVLQHKSAAQIASELADPSTPIARAVLGSANLISGAICQLTANQPAGACPPS